MFLWILNPPNWGLSPLNDGEGEGVVGGGGVEAVMRVLAFHQCVVGSIFRRCFISGSLNFGRLLRSSGLSRGMETLMTLGEMNITLKACKISIVFFIILTFSKCLEPIEKWRKSSYFYRAFKGTTLILLPFKLEAN